MAAVGVWSDRLVLMSVYGVVNVLGTLLFVEGAGLPRRIDVLAKALAVVQLPVGLLGLVAVSSSAMPSDHTPMDSSAHNMPRDRTDSTFRFGGPRDDRRR